MTDIKTTLTFVAIALAFVGAGIDWTAQRFNVPFLSHFARYELCFAIGMLFTILMIVL